MGVFFGIGWIFDGCLMDFFWIVGLFDGVLEVGFSWGFQWIVGGVVTHFVGHGQGSKHEWLHDDMWLLLSCGGWRCKLHLVSNLKTSSQQCRSI